MSVRCKRRNANNLRERFARFRSAVSWGVTEPLGCQRVIVSGTSPSESLVPNLKYHLPLALSSPPRKSLIPDGFQTGRRSSPTFAEDSQP